MTRTYEMHLNLNEQRMALVSLVDSVQASINSTNRLRKIRESERAMALYSLKTKLTALQMAVDQIDELLKVQNAGPYIREVIDSGWSIG